jgi:hypothetical protein
MLKQVLYCRCYLGWKECTWEWGWCHCWHLWTEGPGVLCRSWDLPAVFDCLHSVDGWWCSCCGYSHLQCPLTIFFRVYGTQYYCWHTGSPSSVSPIIQGCSLYVCGLSGACSLAGWFYHSFSITFHQDSTNGMSISERMGVGAPWPWGGSSIRGVGDRRHGGMGHDSHLWGYQKNISWVLCVR